MLFYNTVVVALQRYLVECDEASLNEAIACLETERENPSLSKTAVRFKVLTVDQIEAQIKEEGSLKIRIPDEDEEQGIVQLDGTLAEGRFIRVFAADQEEGTCLVLNVTFLVGNMAVLVPVMPL